MLAGLKFKKQLIRQFFREEIMQESVIYQEILQKGLQQGVQQGLQQGELAVVVRLLTRRIGQVPSEVRSQIEVLPLPQLENLAEALLDFTNLSDLVAWLEASRD